MTRTKVARRPRRNPELCCTLEDLREMLRRAHAGKAEFLPVLATLLRSLSVYSRRGGCPEWLAAAAWDANDRLIGAHNAWHSGNLLTLDRAFGLQRPPRWRQKSAQLRAAHFWPVYMEVTARINDGEKTPEVFDEVARSGEFPVKTSQIRDWYYEGEKRAGLTERPATFHNKHPKRGNTKRV